MKTIKNQLLFSASDFQRINSLLEIVHNDVAFLLEEELARATVMPDESLPMSVVSMNSTARFRDLDSLKETEVQIVYPHEADADKNKISVLAPMGAALIGLSIGQCIEWPVPNGRKRKIKVVSVVKEIQNQAS